MDLEVFHIFIIICVMSLISRIYRCLYLVNIVFMIVFSG